MLKRILFVALVLGLLLWALASCKPSHGPDLTSECQKGKTIELTVFIYEDQSAMNMAAKPFDLVPERGTGELLGFATMVKGTDRHMVHVPMPRGQKDKEAIETWGHELMHSICGPWHPVG